MNTIEREEGYPLSLRETLLAMIEGSVNSNQYRTLYVRTPEGVVDVIGDGDLACAYYFSSVLTLCGLLNGGVHTTVDESVLDLRESGWLEAQFAIPQPGDVVVWESKLCSDKKLHRHIGFCVGGGWAVSNSSTARSPQRHHLTFGVLPSGLPERAIEAVYFHKRLNPSQPV